jgi:hypothetical protein
MCRAYTAPLLERHKAVSGVISADDTGPGGRRAAVRKIRAGRYDAAVIVHPTAKDTLLVRAAGVPIRVGNAYRWYSFLYNRPVFFHRSDAKRHELEYNLLYLKGLGLEYPNYAPSPRVRLLDSDVSAARELLGGLADDGYIIIHPGSGGSSLNVLFRVGGAVNEGNGTYHRNHGRAGRSARGRRSRPGGRRFIGRRADRFRVAVSCAFRHGPLRQWKHRTDAPGGGPRAPGRRPLLAAQVGQPRALAARRRAVPCTYARRLCVR